MDTTAPRTILRKSDVRWAALGLGLASLALSAVILWLGTADTYRWLAAVCLPGGLVLLGYAALGWPRLGPRGLALVALIPVAGLLLSLGQVWAHPGGDFWHMDRGYPVRWLLQANMLNDGPTLWELYWPGLAMDYLTYLNAGVLVVAVLTSLLRLRPGRRAPATPA